MIVRPRFLCLIAAVFGLAVSIVATRPLSSATVSMSHGASFWSSVPGFALCELILPRKYTVFYCYGEPPAHRDEIVRSAVIGLNTLFWPSLVGLCFAATYSVRRWGRSMKELASGILHSPALLIFVCFAILAAFLLGRALYGDQSTHVVYCFWPGVGCFFIAGTALVVWIISNLRPGNHAHDDSGSSHERI